MKIFWFIKLLTYNIDVNITTHPLSITIFGSACVLSHIMVLLHSLNI